jgi:hypothetical protein
MSETNAMRREGYGLKGPIGLGEWNVSGSFPFDKLRVRMTAKTDNGKRLCGKTGT